MDFGALGDIGEGDATGGQTIRAVGQGVDDPERPQTLWGLWSESIVSIGGALRGYHSRQFIVVPAGDSPLPNLLLTQ